MFVCGCLEVRRGMTVPCAPCHTTVLFCAHVHTYTCTHIHTYHIQIKTVIHHMWIVDKVEFQDVDELVVAKVNECVCV